MLAVLSSIEFDPLGVVQIDVLPSAVQPERRRRMNRIATLDGGAVTNDAGYSDADLTIDLRWHPVQITDEAVDRMARLYSRVNVSTRDGAFLTAIESFLPGADESTMRLLVLERLSDI